MKIINKLSKKLFDFVLAFIGLIVLSPLLITITIGNITTNDLSILRLLVIYANPTISACRIAE